MAFFAQFSAAAQNRFNLVNVTETTNAAEDAELQCVDKFKES